jgi:hypothetical protein
VQKSAIFLHTHVCATYHTQETLPLLPRTTPGIGKEREEIEQSSTSSDGNGEKYFVFVWLVCVTQKWVSDAATSEEKEAFGICRDGNHVVGKWVYNASLTNQDKSFYCCGWDHNDFTSNFDLCGIGSMAEWGKLFYGRDRGLAQAGGHACTCDSAGGNANRLVMHPREKYQWVPTYCNLLPWNATQFCELLGDRVVLLRGDSTSVQMAVTLMNMIVAKGGKCQQQIASSAANLLGFKDRDQFLLQEAVRATPASW